MSALLPGRIAESIERAAKHLEPARIGWNVIDDHEHTFCRRWIRRPDKMLDDPFGQRNVRANMHPGYQNPDAIAPAGPVDPALTVLSVQSAKWPAHRGAGQLFDALLRSRTGLGRLFRPVRRGAGEADRRRSGRPAICRDHVARHQRRPDVDGLRPAQEGPGSRCLCRRGRPVRPAGVPIDHLSRLGFAGDGRDQARAWPSRAR